MQLKREAKKKKRGWPFGRKKAVVSDEDTTLTPESVTQDATSEDAQATPDVTSQSENQAEFEQSESEADRASDAVGGVDDLGETVPDSDSSEAEGVSNTDAPYEEEEEESSQSVLSMLYTGINIEQDDDEGDTPAVEETPTEEEDSGEPSGDESLDAEDRPYDGEEEPSEDEAIIDSGDSDAVPDEDEVVSTQQVELVDESEEEHTESEDLFSGNESGEGNPMDTLQEEGSDADRGVDDYSEDDTPVDEHSENPPTTDDTDFSAEENGASDDSDASNAYGEGQGSSSSSDVLSASAPSRAENSMLIADISNITERDPDDIAILGHVSHTCPRCEQLHDLTVFQVPETLNKGDLEVTFMCNYQYCSNNHEVFVDASQIFKNHTALCEAYKQKRGLITAEQIRSLLWRYSFTNAVLETILSWESGTVQRYIDGEVQSDEEDEALRRVYYDPKWVLRLITKKGSKLPEDVYDTAFDAVSLLLTDEDREAFKDAAGSATYDDEAPELPASEDIGEGSPKELEVGDTEDESSTDDTSLEDSLTTEDTSNSSTDSAPNKTEKKPKRSFSIFPFLRKKPEETEAAEDNPFDGSGEGTLPHIDLSDVEGAEGALEEYDENGIKKVSTETEKPTDVFHTSDADDGEDSVELETPPGEVAVDDETEGSSGEDVADEEPKKRGLFGRKHNRKESRRERKARQQAEALVSQEDEDEEDEEDEDNSEVEEEYEEDYDSEEENKPSAGEVAKDVFFLVIELGIGVVVTFIIGAQCGSIYLQNLVQGFLGG